MNKLLWICFLIYVCALGWEDLRSRRVSLSLILAGTLTGAVLRILVTHFEGLPWYSPVIGLAPACLWGGLLLIISVLSRGAVGRGDGLCFLSFAVWLDFTEIFGLLWLSLFLAAGLGGLLWLFRKKGLKASMPFLPFVAAGALLLILPRLFRGA